MLKANLVTQEVMRQRACAYATLCLCMQLQLKPLRLPPCDVKGFGTEPVIRFEMGIHVTCPTPSVCMLRKGGYRKSTALSSGLHRTCFDPAQL